MVEIKMEFVFVNGLNRRRYTKNFYGESLNNIMIFVNAFAKQMSDKGWQLHENKIISVKQV